MATEIMVTKKQLAARGWTDSMIKKAGLSFKSVNTDKGRYHYTTYYYPFSEVKSFEQTKDFIRMKAASEKRKDANELKRLKKEQENRAFVEKAISDIVPPKRIPFEELYDMAIDDNMRMQIEKEPDTEKATKQQLRLYVHYFLMPYRRKLDDIPMGYKGMYRQACDDVIRQVYPELN